MYTLRTFKNIRETNRSQISLGSNYQVKGVCDEDEKLGIISRVFSSAKNIPDDGICIYKDDYAFIMTESGKTFETLNRP